METFLRRCVCVCVCVCGVCVRGEVQKGRVLCMQGTGDTQRGLDFFL